MATRLALPATLVGACLGLVASDAGHTTIPLLAAVMATALVAPVAALRRPAAAIACAGLALGLGLGAWRGAALPLPTGPDSVSALIGRGDVRLVGTVVDDPRPRERSQQVVLEEIAVGRPGGGVAPVRGRLLVSIPRGISLAVGARVAVVAEVEQPEAFDGFDYPALLARQGIGGVVRARAADAMPSRAPPGPAQIAASARRWLLDGLNGMIPEPEAALGAGILLGVRSGIAPEIADAFAAAGLTHVVAISGWNIAIVAAIVASLARPLERRRGGRWMAPAVAGLTIAAYVVLTGASPSVVRAALMAGAMLVARLGGSRAHAASALALAALVMLLAAPSVLWDVGFQLSALATGGLILFAAPIESRLTSLPSWVREPVALTLAAQLTTLPIVVGSFERISLVAPAANVVVVPLVPLVMLLSAIAAPLGALDATFHPPIVGDLARWALGGAAWLTLRAMIVAGQAAAAIPLASLPFTAPAWLALAWYPLLGLAWRRVARSSVELDQPARTGEAAVTELRARRRQSAGLALARSLAGAIARPAGLLVATGMLLGALTLATRPDGRTHLVVLDIGQGDAILIASPSGATALIDGGPDPDLLLRRLGERLPWWRRRIDVMILTHPHEDHVAGLLAALERYDVRLILDAGRDYPNPSYARFRELARDEPSARLVAARAGQRIRLDASTTLTVLFPSDDDAAGPLPEADINNASVVTILRTGGFSALLSGDAEAPVEAILAQRTLFQPVDVLKVGHHGSNSSTTPALLESTRPRVAIISTGIGNDYGHPHRITLEHLAAIPGLMLHRTDLEGSVEVITDGQRFMVTSRAGDDPWRPVRDAAGSTPADRPAGSIDGWRFPPSPMPSACLIPSRCPMGSWSIRAASAAWLPRPPDSWRRAGSTLIRSSSRSPPCCMTSTSPRPGELATGTGSSPRAG